MSLVFPSTGVPKFLTLHWGSLAMGVPEVHDRERQWKKTECYRRPERRVVFARHLQKAERARCLLLFPMVL